MKTQRASQPEITQELNKLFQEAHATSKPPRIPELVSAILADALREGVSDVHLDPAPNVYQLRFGLMVYSWTPPPSRESKASMFCGPSRLMLTLIPLRLAFPRPVELSLQSVIVPSLSGSPPCRQ